MNEARYTSKIRQFSPDMVLVWLRNDQTGEQIFYNVYKTAAKCEAAVDREVRTDAAKHGYEGRIGIAEI